MIVLLPLAAGWAVARRVRLAVAPLLGAAFVYAVWFLYHALELGAVGIGIEVFLPLAATVGAAWVFLIYVLLRPRSATATPQATDGV